MVLLLPSNNFLAKDKRLLVPYLNQQDTKYQLLCNGLLPFFPSLPLILSPSFPFLQILSQTSYWQHSGKWGRRIHKEPKTSLGDTGSPSQSNIQIETLVSKKKKKSPLADSKESRGREGWGGGGIIIIKVKGRRTHHLPATVTMQRALLRSPAPKQNQKFMFLQVHSHTHPCMWCYMCIYVCEGRRSTWTVFGSGSIFWNKVSHCTGVHPFIE